MFREMRRSGQALSGAECREILEKGTSGVLAVSGDGGWPYAVPLSYVLDGDGILFHCARQGQKLDALARDGRASFCVVDQDEVLPEKYTTLFRSVIVFGRVRVLSGESEKHAALLKLAAKYTPGDEAGRTAEAESALPRVCMLRLGIEHMTGKEAVELTRQRRVDKSGAED